MQQEQNRGWWWFPERGIARTLLELLIVVPAYALYQLVRGTVDGRTSEAFHRAATVVDVEQALGIFWEAELQSLVATQELAVRAVNTIYVWGHLPLIIIVAIWLFSFHRSRYALFRNAFLISGAIALFFFWLAPTAPPRYLQYWGFVDTAVSSGSYYFFQPPAFVNQYAAMPSLHFGWSLLAAIAIFANLRAPFRYVALVMPVFTLAGIVLTGNHFFLDAVAGGAVACTGLWVAYQLHARLPRYKPFTVLT
ncbi:MAG: phosphatase PAP2 family protein [Dehalococcoidia bacterium]